MDSIVSKEKQNQLWTTDRLREILLQSTSGVLAPFVDFPQVIELNSLWLQIMEEVFHLARMGNERGRQTLFLHPEENGRAVKTDIRKKKLFVQSSNTIGSEDCVFTQAVLEEGENLVGRMHKHPTVATLNTEDLIPLIRADGLIFEGLVDLSLIHI